MPRTLVRGTDSSVQIAATVADKGLTGDHLGVVADHEGDEVGQVVGLDAILYRLVAHHPVESFFVVVSVRALGRHHARHYGVAVDPYFADLAVNAPGDAL